MKVNYEIVLIVFSVFIEIYQVYTEIVDRKEKKKEVKKTKLEGKRDILNSAKNQLVKLNINKIQMLNEIVENKNDKTSPEAIYDINQMWWTYKDEYDNIKPVIERTSPEVMADIDKFTNIFESNHLFSEKFEDKFMKLRRGENKPAAKINEDLKKGLDEKYLSAAKNISDYYNAALSAIEKVINSISEELVNL